MSKGLQVTVMVLVIFMGIGCKNSRKRKNLVEGIFSKKNFTEYKLDSTSVESFLNGYTIPDSIKEEINEFYERRNYQFAWFSEKRLINAADNFYGQLKSYVNDFADSTLYDKEVDRLFLEKETDEKKFLADKKQTQKLELLLTTNFFIYSHKAYSGTVKNPLDLEWFIPRKKKDYKLLLDTIISSDSSYCIHEPVNRYYTSLKEKLREYRALEKKGNWPQINLSKKEFVQGSSDTAIAKVKLLLSLTGDFKLKDSSALFTDSLKLSVKNFQRRMGITETGKIDAATLAEMNVPVSTRIRQMMINMERLRWVPAETEPDFVLVNIPEFKLHVFEKGKLVWNTNVVVGKAANKTTIFKGKISQIILNPYWVITSNIIENEILPKLKQHPAYISENDMEVLSGKKILNADTIKWNRYKTNVPFTIRQKPGKNNSLGKIKFLFPNSYDIYLHDTPAKNLFGETNRTFSHGCIRVAEPQTLAKYILRNNPSWKEEKFNEAFSSDEEKDITIKPQVPVYIVYFTTWVDSQGQLNFRKDVYDLDDILAKEIFD